MKIFLITITLFLAILNSKAQHVREFSQDTTNYPSELRTLFDNLLSDEDEVVFNQFLETWQFIDYEKRQEIMAVSELMRQRSCRPKNQYILFIKILEEFHGEGKLDRGYNDWMEGYRSFMQKENSALRDIDKINHVTFLILTYSNFYHSTTLSWKLQTANYQFVFDSALRVLIDDNTIIGASSGDSIIINNAKGYIDPLGQVFIGQQGKVLWERAGLDAEVVYAELKDYRIPFNKLGYTADSVVFHHNQLLDAPALGSLEDRISQIRVQGQAAFPKFSSYQSSYILNDIVPGINYRGAISMQGANLVGQSAEGQNAELIIYQNDTVRVRMSSKQFLFSPKLIKSGNAAVSIYLEDDSIYHPDLVVNYEISREIMRLTKSNDFNSQGPFANTYHSIDMSFDELNWVRSEPEMNLQAALGTALGNGLFESFDYFDLTTYENLQGMEYQNPLADLYSYSNMVGGMTFSVEGYAAYMGKAAYILRHQFMQLSKAGFVYFDFEVDEVTLRPKLFDYIDASLMKRDYDVIRFISRTDAGKENAKLDLQTKDLTINGIPTIFLSDSQNVRLVPLNNSIIMKRNRDFQFDGIIDAGLFKFYGKNFFFEYDNFRVNLQNIDSLSISAKTEQKDAFGNALITTLDNKIQNITGELLIDAPFNKSGLTSFPEYPIFTSRENSYVYFDDKSIQNGVYDRSRFYFELLPFSIDTLDNFSREALKMEGTFISADILPPLEMEMTLRPDNSLGFYMNTPENGIPIFGGKATFFNDIEMSSSGLRGYGSMDYITSTTWSDNFLFHPDSVITKSREFIVREERGSVSYPLVNNGIAEVGYYPVDDVMRINQIEQSFKIFNDTVNFGGNLALRPSGITGSGRLNFPDGRFDSEVFRFQAQVVLADSAGVKLRKPQDQDFSWITEDVSVQLDMIQREGSFKSRGDYTLIDMPANLYETRLNQINWFMDRDEVVMKQTVHIPENQIDVGIDSLRSNGPSYISNHPKQDSLNFVSNLATFNYVTNELNAEKVKFMEIGDAYVFPDKGKVQVLEKAVIKPLRNAKLLANRYSRYHLLHSANLTIDSRNHFRGQADYDYIDEFDNVYTIHMNHVEVDTSINTFAKGEVVVADSFRLSPFYEYQGQISMNAQMPFLNFLGGVRLTHDCDVGKAWLKFNADINPDSILIPLESRMQNLDLNNIYAGTFKARDSIHIYPSFLSGRKQYFDKNVTYSDGFLFYDKSSNTYKIAGLQKMSNMQTEGNYLSLQTDSCILYGEGEIDLALEYGRINIKTFGNATHKIPNNSLDMNLLMGLDFHFSSEALAVFGNELDSLPDLEPVDLTQEDYKLSVRNLVGKTIADKLENELGLYGNYTAIPDSMKFSILFNELKLNWNQETRSYRYNGKVGIGIIGDVQVNKKVDAYMEFVERGSGDIFDIYLMVDDNTWYYMAYSPGGFQVLSSNRDFNAIIMDTPDKDRTLKSRRRQPSYVYSLASTRRLQLFLDRFLTYEEENSD
jgi:hypothetical protein